MSHRLKDQILIGKVGEPCGKDLADQDPTHSGNQNIGHPGQIQSVQPIGQSGFDLIGKPRFPDAALCGRERTGTNISRQHPFRHSRLDEEHRQITMIGSDIDSISARRHI